MSYLEGMTVLNFAIANNDESISLLLKDQTKNLADKCGRTPLHIAIDKGNYVLVENLLKMGCDVNVQDINGNTALIRLVRHFDSIDIKPLLRLLLQYKPSAVIANFKGETCLDAMLCNYTYGGTFNRRYNSEIIDILLQYDNTLLDKSSDKIQNLAKEFFDDKCELVSDFLKFKSELTQSIIMYRDNIWKKIYNILKRNNGKMLCPACYGVKKYTYTTKRINVHVCDASDTIVVTDYCPTCEGKGKLNNYDINFFVDKFELLRYYGDIKTNKHFISIRDILK